MRPPPLCPLVGRLEEAGKASIPDRLFALALSDDYGFFSTIMPEVAHICRCLQSIIIMRKIIVMANALLRDGRAWASIRA
jgi:hypothetical protein